METKVAVLGTRLTCVKKMLFPARVKNHNVRRTNAESEFLTNCHESSKLNF
jgi:hypothetical protein